MRTESGGKPPHSEMMTSIAELRARHRDLNPRDVDLLIADALGQSLAWVFAHRDAEVDATSIEPQLRRRAAGEPLQYIRGRADFYGREFLVDDRVLIPRPETELLVEQAIRRAPHGAAVVDAGTGSGCIAISLALERPDLRVIATDISVAALALAKTNRDRLGARVTFVAGDLLDAVRRVDLVVSNPPYIPASDIDGLQVEVRNHEPRNALTPGVSGLEVIERLVQTGLPLMFEIGFGQIDAVRALTRVDAVIPDLAGIPRVVISSAHGE